MKKLMMAAAIALLATTAIQAQDNNASRRNGGNRPDEKEMIQRRTDMTVKQYKLNDQQAKQLLELNQKYSGKIGGMRGGFGRNGGAGMGRGSRNGGPRGNRGFQGRPDSTRMGARPEMTEEMRAQMEKARKDREEAQKKYEEELKTIMTPDQFKAYQADQEEMRRNFGNRRGGGNGPRRGGNN